MDVYLIGAGVVGRAVAAAHLRAGVPFHLVEIDAARLDAAVTDLQSACGAFTIGRDSAWGGGYSRLIVPHTDDAGKPKSGGDYDALVVESVLERRDLKRDVLADAFARLSDQAGKRILLATNTSTLPLRDLIDDRYPADHLIGLHFFMPVEHRPLVEVIRGTTSCSEAISTGVAHAKRLHRDALVVADAPGFVVNRMLAPYLNQALHAFCQGASAEQIERVATSAGMPMGPLELLDWIGMETGFHAGRAMWQAFPKRIDPAPLLPGMVKAKLFGRHTGVGFYTYTGGKRSAEISAAAEARRQAYTHQAHAWTDAELRDWIFLPMLLEAACLLLDGVVAAPNDVEVAMRGGLGWRNANGWLGLWEGVTAQDVAKALALMAERSRTFAPPAAFIDSLAKAQSLQVALSQLVSPASPA